MSRPTRAPAAPAQAGLWAEPALPVAPPAAKPLPSRAAPAPVAATVPGRPPPFRWADVLVAMPPMPPKQVGAFRWPDPCDPKPVGEVNT
jgi:hypothetical protein